MSDFERVIGMADSYGTRATVRAYDDDDEPTMQLALEVGMSGARAFPTVEAARQLAAALLDAADRVEQARTS